MAFINPVTAVVDTHALIWLLEKNPKLGKRAEEILTSGSTKIIIPVIVLCELYYYLKKKKATERYYPIYKALTDDARVTILSLEASHIFNIPEHMELHDGLIAALVITTTHAILLSKDSILKKWGGSKVIWN